MKDKKNEFRMIETEVSIEDDRRTISFYWNCNSIDNFRSKLIAKIENLTKIICICQNTMTMTLVIESFFEKAKNIENAFPFNVQMLDEASFTLKKIPTV